MITEKENVLRLFRGDKSPEWIPIVEKCMHIMIPSVVFERPKWETGKDWFGCEWYYDEESHGHTPMPGAEFVLDDITEWREKVVFPDLDAIDFEAAAKEDLADVDRENKAILLFWESGPFERSHHLLGFENAFVAMYEEPEAYAELTMAIAQWRAEAMTRCFKAYKPDFVFSHDDLGHAHAPFMSIDTYRKFIKPCHKLVIDAVHDVGALYVNHSCGCMQQYIGDLIEIGVDAINPLQGDPVNNVEQVARDYAGKVVFQGGIAPFIHNPGTTEEQLRAEVRKVCDLFAPTKSLILDLQSLGPGVTDILLDESESYGFDYWRRNGYE
ncbi:MAG: hypothetical protein K6G78_02415 [bacterium]|nr:hypothetical protein [bacterium]